MYDHYVWGKGIRSPCPGERGSPCEATFPPSDRITCTSENIHFTRTTYVVGNKKVTVRQTFKILQTEPDAHLFSNFVVDSAQFSPSMLLNCSIIVDF